MSLEKYKLQTAQKLSNRNCIPLFFLEFSILSIRKNVKRSANFVKHCQEIVEMLTRFSLSIANLGEKIVKDYVFFFALGAVQKCVNLVDLQKIR